MAANIRYVGTYRIKQSADNPNRFWIIDDVANTPVETGKDRKGNPVMFLEAADFDEAEKWVLHNLHAQPSATVSPDVGIVVNAGTPKSESVSPPIAKIDDNVVKVDFEAQLPHIVSETMCVKCLTRFIDVRPVGVLLKDLECPKCGPGFMIDTGEGLG